MEQTAEPRQQIRRAGRIAIAGAVLVVVPIVGIMTLNTARAGQLTLNRMLSACFILVVGTGVLWVALLLVQAVAILRPGFYRVPAILGAILPTLVTCAAIKDGIAGIKPIDWANIGAAWLLLFVPVLASCRSTRSDSPSCGLLLGLLRVHSA